MLFVFDRVVGNKNDVVADADHKVLNEDPVLFRENHVVVKKDHPLFIQDRALFIKDHTVLKADHWVKLFFSCLFGIKKLLRDK